MFYFKENPNNREEQVSILKSKLSIKFDSRFKKLNLEFDPNCEVIGSTILDVKNNKQLFYKWSIEHFKECWVAMEFSKFVSSDDNSIRGFKTKCVASFEN